MSVRRSLIVLAFLMVTLPLCAFYSRASQLTQSQPETNLQFYAVRSGSVELNVTGIGRIEAEAVADLSFTRTGRVAEVLVQAGDSVQAGEPLLRLSNDAEQIAYDRAVLSLQLADLQKQDLVDGPDEGQIRVAEANVNSAWGAYTGLQNAVTPEQIQAAELRYQQAQQAYVDAIDTRNNPPQGGQPEEYYTILDAQIGAASFNAEIARLQLEDLRAGNRGALNAAYARVLQAQSELERVQAGPTQAQIDQADIAIQQAQIQVDQAGRALGLTVLVAPFDGVVSLLNVEVGSLVSPALPAVQLTNVSPLHVLVQIDEIDIRQVQELMPARVELDALPGVTLPATIEQIALVGTNNNGIINYDVRVRLDSSDPRVRTGMTAEASVVVEDQRDVLVVPNEYIRLDRRTDQAFVNIVSAEGQLQEIEVTLGLVGDVESEVISGLKAGDVLAIDLGGDQLGIFGG